MDCEAGRQFVKVCCFYRIREEILLRDCLQATQKIRNANIIIKYPCLFVALWHQLSNVNTMFCLSVIDLCVSAISRVRVGHIW